jgi:hypothetical protein
MVKMYVGFTLTKIKEEARATWNGDSVRSNLADESNVDLPTSIRESQSKEAIRAICQTIRNLSTDASVKSIRGLGIVYYYDAVRHAFDSDTPLRHFLEAHGVKASKEIDKNLKCIWAITDSIIKGTDPRVKVVNKDPDNFQVSWKE